MEITEISFNKFSRESKQAGITATAGGKYFLVYESDIIGGFKLVSFPKYIRIGNLFIIPKRRQHGWVPHILLYLLNYYQTSLRARAFPPCWKYWMRYATEIREITSNVKEFQIIKEKVEKFIKSKERTKNG